MLRRSPVLLLASLWLIANWGCGPEPDLTALKVVPQISGYYDDGIVQDGKDIGQNRILPAVTFQIKNEGKLPAEYVDITVAFWRVVNDQEYDSKLLRPIGRPGLAPGASTESLTVRSTVGYTSPLTQAADFFAQTGFVDFKVKVFARRAGINASLGEIIVERRLLPAARKDGFHP
jgi:hypothetical protein